MEYTIRIVVAIVVLVIIAVIILSLLGVFGERSNWIVDGIFGFFDNLFGGKSPIDGGGTSGGAVSPGGGDSLTGGPFGVKDSLVKTGTS
jgi:hypothetical protein